MSWQDIIKMGEAKDFLREDVGNVLRELEEFEGLGLDKMDLPEEMKELSKALGKVSALLQDWL